MARRVVFHAAASVKLDPSQFPRDDQGNLKPISLCACGVSQKFPICDGTHKRCKDETPGVLYEYDPVTLERREVGVCESSKTGQGSVSGA